MGLITAPGIYDVPAEEYHRDPVAGGSLSSTGARRLLPPSCPALFKHELDHPSLPTAAMNLGTAAHRVVLGVGPELVDVGHDTYHSKSARTARDEALARGAVPLKPKELKVVRDMAAALRAHPIASQLYAPGSGHPEQTLVWRDRATGIMCRARLDWLPAWNDAARLIIPDYKTAAAADTESFEKAMADRGYHQQAAFYLDGVRTLGLARDPAFLFVVQEKTEPYLVHVVQPDIVAMRLADQQNAAAREIYRQCSTTGVWPGYSDSVDLVALPAYAEHRIEAAIDRGDYQLDLEESA